MNAVKLLLLDIRDLAHSMRFRKRASRMPAASTPFNLLFFSPYAQDGNLGRAYNEYMDLVPHDDDWVCFYDRDVMFLTPDYGSQIREIISLCPDAGLLTCLTNRIGCPAQLYEGTVSDEPNILHHAAIAVRQQQHHRLEVEKIPAPVSGFLMVIKKRVWRNVRFSEQRELLGVDWQFSKRLAAKGYPIHLMKGLYVFHYYRLREGINDTRHLETGKRMVNFRA
jgi:GT2 family glycosyltransferase